MKPQSCEQWIDHIRAKANRHGETIACVSFIGLFVLALLTYVAFSR